MKILFLILLFSFVVLSTSLLAQIELTLVGGLNLSSVKCNDNTVDNYVDFSVKSGLLIGVETIGGPFIIGGVYIQRGVKSKYNDIYYGEITQTDTYNYLSGYLLYPVSIQKQLSIFGGCQLGKSIGGTLEAEGEDFSGSTVMKAEDFNLDFGFLFGADVMLNMNIGLRGSYFVGLSDVMEGVPSNYNFKNRGIGICLLYKI